MPVSRIRGDVEVSGRIVVDGEVRIMGVPTDLAGMFQLVMDRCDDLNTRLAEAESRLAALDR